MREGRGKGRERGGGEGGGREGGRGWGERELNKDNGENRWDRGGGLEMGGGRGKRTGRQGGGRGVVKGTALPIPTLTSICKLLKPKVLACAMGFRCQVSFELPTVTHVMTKASPSW